MYKERTNDRAREIATERNKEKITHERKNEGHTERHT